MEAVFDCYIDELPERYHMALYGTTLLKGRALQIWKRSPAYDPDFLMIDDQAFRDDWLAKLYLFNSYIAKAGACLSY